MYKNGDLPVGAALAAFIAAKAAPTSYRYRLVSRNSTKCNPSMALAIGIVLTCW